MRQITKEELLELSKSNYLKIIIKSCKKQKQFDNLYQSCLTESKNGYKIEVIDVVDVCQLDNKALEENIQQCSSPLDIINTYIDVTILEDDIDKDTLKTVFYTLYQEYKMKNQGV